MDRLVAGGTGALGRAGIIIDVAGDGQCVVTPACRSGGQAHLGCRRTGCLRVGILGPDGRGVVRIGRKGNNGRRHAGLERHFLWLGCERRST